MVPIPGMVDLLVEPQVGLPQVQINLDRSAAPATGLRAADLASMVDTAFNGEADTAGLKLQLNRPAIRRSLRD